MTAPLPLISTADLRGRRVLVLGLARSGVAATRMLVDAGAEVTVYDRRSADDLGPALAGLEGRTASLALAVEPAEAELLMAAAEMVVTSPSISARFPTTDSWLREAMVAAEERGVPVMGEVDLFLSLTRARVLAVTGTKGKTTTTALIGAMLDAAGLPHAVGGNIGTPLIERVDELGPAHWAVLELSELQLPTIPRGADIAVYTNIGADHLDRHASVEAYRGVKARLAELSGDGIVILNADDPGCRELGARLSGDLRWYGLDDGSLAASVRDGLVTVEGEPVLPAADVPLPGRHMLGNVLAAALGSRLAGASATAIADGVTGFAGVPHRLEALGEHAGVHWVNDSQATIPLAAVAGLEAFAPAPVVLIAGGRGKGLDYAAFVETMVRRARAVVLIGESADALEALVAGRLRTLHAATMDEAVRLAAELAQPGDVVLLSPAAASFDMYADYAARGDAFRAAVADLYGGAA